MIISYLFRFLTRVLAGNGLGRNAFIANTYIRMAKKALPDFILFKENKIFLESENSLNLASFGFKSEEYELLLFESEVSASSVVLDIGASIGLYTLIAAKYANKVYSFEPDPVTFLNLKKNVEGNYYENVVLVNKAVSDRNGESKFFSSSNKSTRDSNHLVSDYDNENEKFIMVELVALDDFFNDKTKRIDVIKMDIEGTEFEAIRGMKKLVVANKKLKLFLEFNPYALSRQGVDISSLLDLLSDLNFCLYYIDELNKIKKPVDKDWLLSFAQNKREGHYINLLGIRNTCKPLGLLT
jgi:FkbM family methyltransferase